MLREGRAAAVEVPTPETRELPQSARAKLDRAGRRKLRRACRPTKTELVRLPPDNATRDTWKKFRWQCWEAIDVARARIEGR